LLKKYAISIEGLWQVHVSEDNAFVPSLANPNCPFIGYASFNKAVTIV